MKHLFPQKLKNIYHLGKAIVANLMYGFPSKRIKVIGVTGTNGKTTTVQMITRILEEAGHKVAMASTINFKLDKKEWVNVTKYTTLSAFSVQKFIRQAVDAGCGYLVLETSSHSLDQNRVWGVKYDVAVITNATREHLDYHKTMEEYRRAKKALFKNINTAVVNMDMEGPEEYMRCNAEHKFGYTLKNQNDKSKIKIIKAEDIMMEIDGSSYKIQNTKYKIHLPGEFNIENALAATCVGLNYGINLEVISQALGKMKGVSGRMERVPNDNGINIIIDYAVTPDSLEKLYSLISKIKMKIESPIENLIPKIIAVFGSCGERDRGKRPIMGGIVDQYADCIILTNEDPYGEDPWQIINEVAEGVRNKKEGENFWKIMDRREAIRKALKMSKAGDFVIVTGKGAEETMATGAKERISWNDRKVILEELANVN
jgi:UDP-N-acetylmuramoyl-L-alanyl-D-glutamate--2,6-diaminopimelate ligase